MDKGFKREISSIPSPRINKIFLININFLSGVSVVSWKLHPILLFM